jgi:hypothetical protein
MYWNISSHWLSLSLNIGGWYVFARRKGLKIYFFFTNSLNYVKYFLISSSSYCSFGVKQQLLTSLLIHQTLFLVVFEYFYDVYLFEINSLAIRRTVTYNERTTLGRIPKFQKNQYLNLFNKRTTGYL